MNRRRSTFGFAAASAALAATCYFAPAYGASCADLASLRLPQTTIKIAESVPGGTYQPPGSAVAFNNLPAFCRVTATINPVAGSSINIEIWLPTSTWNGKYQQSGSHGFGGAFFWGEMVPQIQRGYATAINDTGHGGPGGFNVSWAFGNREAITDFAWRADHETVSKAKLLVKAFYGRPARYAYFNGCSNGGREGMKSAQMFADDFDGIIAGGAAAYWTGAANELLVYSKGMVQAGIQGGSGAAILNLAQKAATAACDAADGVTDGLIRDPRQCHWDPNTLVCTAGQDPSTCITPAQAAVLKTNIEDVRDPVSGRWLMSGQSRGSEFDQIRFRWHIGLNIYSLANYQVAFNDPGWDSSTFDLHTDPPVLDRALGVINALDPDLNKFRKSGGKLIQWHGWDDAAFTPGATARYYERVIRRMGHGEHEDVQDFYRLFMLPGVGHCGSGIGPDNIGGENQIPVSQDPQHDLVSALEAWVERGVAPEKVIATKFNNNSRAQGIQMQRPICPYPQEAVYNGFGDTNKASSFDCRLPFNRRHHDDDD